MTEKYLPPSVVYFKLDHNLDQYEFFHTQLGIQGAFPTCIQLLGEMIALQPRLILFQLEFIQNHDVTVQEFFNMVRTMIKYLPHQHACGLGVVIGKRTTWEKIKELRDGDILGFVPSSGDFGVDEALRAMKSLLDHQSYWPKHITDQLVRKQQLNRTNRSGITLTHRQKQVLDLVCSRGLGNKKIALALKISESTVKIHISAILKQYQVRNRTQLALAARDQMRM